LPDEMRLAIMFREFDGLSYEEIAQIMDCPVGNRAFPNFQGA